MVTVVPSSQFRKAVKHLTPQQRVKLEKMVKKILLNPAVGKPLRYMRGERAMRVKLFRIVYAFRQDLGTLYLLKFENRDSVYG